ncbi:integrase core domain-containing protein [Spirosoma pollinicola]|uniref:Integrase catalytic domain-containing protein n=1 Tax=Spirosoma pollinicola TaxID=2057025 RepID=A0A2K8ZBA7_9BACT|nr:integrase core domain-containing protein [Spirosoma pollinicola]AUD07135.1 hypothetical protein CWM47_02580 [Spirosoma pollinicola]
MLLLNGDNRVFSTARAAPTDQGSQFTCKDFLTPLQEREVAISMDSKGRALDNIFVERFWRTLNRVAGAIRTCLFAGLSRWFILFKGLDTYFHFYNYQRKHQSLDYKTPAQLYVEQTKGE